MPLVSTSLAVNNSSSLKSKTGHSHIGSHIIELLMVISIHIHRRLSKAIFLRHFIQTLSWSVLVRFLFIIALAYFDVLKHLLVVLHLWRSWGLPYILWICVSVRHLFLELLSAVDCRYAHFVLRILLIFVSWAELLVRIT